MLRHRRLLLITSVAATLGLAVGPALAASPTLTASVTDASAAFGATIHDSATLSGGASPTGTITFRVYFPDDPMCQGQAASVVGKTVSGNGSYSASFVAMDAGRFHWTVNYSGDVDNNDHTKDNDPASVACDHTGQSTVVGQASTTTTDVASQPAKLGDAIKDTATLSSASGVAIGGSYTFRAYGPDDPACSGPPAADLSALVLDTGSYTSPTFKPTVAGSYRWIATYSGDDNDAGSSSACNAANSISVVPQRVATLAATAGGQTATGTIADGATLAGGVAPTGTIAFSLYGPDNATCAGAPIFASTAAVNGNGTYASGAFTPTAAGTYRWVAAYGGDQNTAATGGACNDPGQSVVAAAPPPAPVAPGLLGASGTLLAPPPPPSSAFSLGTAKVSASDAITIPVVTAAAGKLTGTASFTETVTRHTGHGRHRHATTTHKTIAFATGNVAVPSGDHATITFKPTASALRLLRTLSSRQHVHVRVALSFRATGAVASVAHTATVLVARPKSKSTSHRH